MTASEREMAPPGYRRPPTFSQHGLCPIALYELGGRAQVCEQALCVGTHPEYKRKLDVVVQLRLARPEVEVAFDTTTLAEQVRVWFTAGAKRSG
jgi:hypothetical protein